LTANKTIKNPLPLTELFYNLFYEPSYAWLKYSRLRAVSCFSLQSYCTRTLRTTRILREKADCKQSKNTHNFTRMEIWTSQPLNMKLSSMIYNVHCKISQSFDWNSSIGVPSILSKSCSDSNNWPCTSRTSYHDHCYVLGPVFLEGWLQCIS